MHARRMTGRTVWHRSVDFRPPGREGTATTRSAAGSTCGVRAGYVRGTCGVLSGVRRGVRPVGRRGVRPAVWGPAARAEVRAGAGPGSGGRNVAGRGAGDVFGGAARRTCPVGAAWGTCRVVGSGGVAGGAGRRRTWPVGGRRRRVRWGCARAFPVVGAQRRARWCGAGACPVVRPGTCPVVGPGACHGSGPRDAARGAARSAGRPERGTGAGGAVPNVAPNRSGSDLPHQTGHNRSERFMSAVLPRFGKERPSWPLTRATSPTVA